MLIDFLSVAFQIFIVYVCVIGWLINHFGLIYIMMVFFFVFVFCFFVISMMGIKLF
jgi:hypothetical protein